LETVSRTSSLFAPPVDTASHKLKRSSRPPGAPQPLEEPPPPARQLLPQLLRRRRMRKSQSIWVDSSVMMMTVIDRPILI